MHILINSINLMPLLICDKHQQVEDIICPEGPSFRKCCPKCYTENTQVNFTGVVLNEKSKQTLIEWNKCLMEKFSQLKSTIQSKGNHSVFEMRLNPEYPKGILGELDNKEVVQVGVIVIDDYLQTLNTNINFISQIQGLEQLDIQQFLKDLYIFFVYQTAKGISFLSEKMKILFIQKFPNKSIYKFVDFLLLPREIRSLELKRKLIIKNVQHQCLMQKKSPISPEREKSETSSPRYLRTESSNRNPLVLSRSRIDRNENLQRSQRISRIRTQNSAEREQSERNVEESTTPLRQESRIRMSIPLGKREKQLTKSEIIQPGEKVFQLSNNLQKRQSGSNGVNSNVQVISEISSINKTTRINQLHQITDLKQSKMILKEQQQLKNMLEEAPSIILNKTLDPNQNLLKQNEELKQQVFQLEKKLRQKDMSIRELNKLIRKEDQDLQWRQNEVQILAEQVKKILQFRDRCVILQSDLGKAKEELGYKERSITQLNKLINNEEQQIQYRENEVETLTSQIRKLVDWKKRYEQLQSQLNVKEKQLNQRQKGIRQLNKLIDNQEEQLAFREGEVATLTSDLNKASQKIKQLENQINILNQTIEGLKKENEQVHLMRTKLEQSVNQYRQKAVEKSFDELLMDQVIEMESQLVSRSNQINRLKECLTKLQK